MHSNGWSRGLVPMGLLLLAACAGLGTGACNKKGPDQVDPREQTEGGDPGRPERFEIDIYAFGRQLGTIAPCGCTTDPLGGLQYAFGYIDASSTAGARLLLEPGSFLYPDPLGPEAPVDDAAWAQAEQRAALLHGRFSKLDGLVSGFGPTDVAFANGRAALERYPMPRVLANVSERPAGVEAIRTIALAEGIEAKVTAVVDPELAKASTWAKDFPVPTDPIAALEALQPELPDAALTVVMIHGPRELAETVAREIDVDVVVMAGVLDNPERSRLGSPAVQIGDTWLLEPGDRAQTIAHLTLSIERGSVEKGELASAWMLAPSRTQQEAELARLDERIKKFAGDPSADPAFMARLESQRDELKAALETNALPDAPVVVIPEQAKVNCRRSTDPSTQEALDEYDAWVAKQNLERFTGVHAPAPAAGQPTYVGGEACADCHAEAAEFWETTVHQRAYETLVTANKQYDLSCVSCHVTGFRKPGGSEVVENELLRAVQCEQCHGPGSAHVEDPVADNIAREAPISLCTECHTPEHSDTFEYDAYLRDVLGEGHGAEKRASLGQGPTGRELRAAGLAKAGGACKKPM